MANYTFSTLNDKDLEELVRDLLIKELSIQFQSFKVGKDKGIDLRYSTNSSENEIIVQVKHYLKSGYSKLIYNIKNQEKRKVEDLNPRRYIIATSIDLSPNDKEKIKEVLTPYILNTNDIYGGDDINSLLTKYEEIEKKYFKLWFSNTKILQRIINNGIEGRSIFYEEKIKKNIGLYVINSSYNKALEKLNDYKILLITGIPGIGKTTLANLIVYELLSKDYKLVYIDDKIREGEDLFDPDSKVKQVFYFDDFLGSNYLEIVNPSNTDKSIVNFIERIKVSKNKLLVLTTRSSILNQARSRHEKLYRANLDGFKYELVIENYRDIDKAKILYNHLYFNDLNLDFINEIFRDENYWKIIKHKNYNPRLVEYFTNTQNINHLSKEEYFDFILYNLDNPEEIWSSAFINQLSEDEKYLLFVLLSFGRSVYIEYLENAFDAKIEYEVIHHGHVRRINIFNIAIKNLLDGYITNTYLVYRQNYCQVDFINPSLRDYLISFFNQNNSEKWKLIESFIYVDQFLKTFNKNKDSQNQILINPSEVRKFLEIANSKNLISIQLNDVNQVKIRIAYLNLNYRDEKSKDYIDQFIMNYLESIEWLNLNVYNLNELLDIIQKIGEESKIYNYILDNWEQLIQVCYKSADEDIQLSRIKEIFSQYQKEYIKYYKENEMIFDSICDAVERIFISESEYIIDEERSNILTEDDYNKLEDRVYDTLSNLTTDYLDGYNLEPQKNPLDNIDLAELIANNESSYRDEEIEHDRWKDERYNYLEETEMIDNLFSGFEK